MTPDHLPLRELFETLRCAGVPLGLDEYFVLLDALRAGYGSGGPDDLARLCRTLWIKTGEEERLFDAAFEQIEPLLPTSRPDEAAVESSPDEPSPGSGAAQGSAQPPPAQPPTKPVEKPKTDESMSGPSIPRTGRPEPAQKKSPRIAAKTIFEVEDEVQIAQTLMIERDEEDGSQPAGRFTRTDEYFPINRRQLKQSWRYLRRTVREGPPVEFDLEATVRQIGRHGILLKPEFRPRRLNRAELLLLIDQDGSMVPFHALSRRLLETAERGGKLKAGAYYFHNCPLDNLYHDPFLLDWESVDDVLRKFHPQRTAVLIFSDAGSARGGFNPERILLTERFLNKLKGKLRHIAWLNPMPRRRWAGTPADHICRMVPMFTFSRREVHEAIAVLRGRSRPRSDCHFGAGNRNLEKADLNDE